MGDSSQTRETEQVLRLTFVIPRLRSGEAIPKESKRDWNKPLRTFHQRGTGRPTTSTSNWLTGTNSDCGNYCRGLPLLAVWVVGRKSGTVRSCAAPGEELDRYLLKIGGKSAANIFGRLGDHGHLECRLFFQPESVSCLLINQP